MPVNDIRQNNYSLYLKFLNQLKQNKSSPFASVIKPLVNNSVMLFIMKNIEDAKILRIEDKPTPTSSKDNNISDVKLKPKYNL